MTALALWWQGWPESVLPLLVGRMLFLMVCLTGSQLLRRKTNGHRAGGLFVLVLVGGGLPDK